MHAAHAFFKKNVVRTLGHVYRDAPGVDPQAGAVLVQVQLHRRVVSGGWGGMGWSLRRLLCVWFL